MDDRILGNVKKLLGIDDAFTDFDVDICIAINTALSTLTQIGIGPKNGFKITSDETTWSEFIGERKDIESVKTFVYLKTKLIFDPPANSFLVNAIEKQLDELTWRLNVSEDVGGLYE